MSLINEKNLKLARDVLRFNSFRTVEATTGEDALLTAREHLPDLIGAQFLEGRIGIHSLVVSIGIEKRRSLVGHDLLQDCRHRFSFGKPLPPFAGEKFL